MKFNYLLPIGIIRNDLLIFLGVEIRKIFGMSYRILDGINHPIKAFARARNQYNADIILKEISLINFDNANKIIALIDKDIFSQDFKYIFGEAESPGRISLISIKRLNPEFYGQKYNQDVFFERTYKEVLHELGHNYNLSHCPDRNCAMYFSNTLADTDYKKTSYCTRCKKLIEIYNN